MSKFLKNKPLIINLISFQLLWLVCVQGNNLYAIGALATFVLTHHFFVLKYKIEWLHALIFLVVGFFIESILGSTQLVNFYQSLNININGIQLSLAPPWLLALWIGFSTTYFHGLEWIRGRNYLQSTMVIIFIPLNYYSGALLSGTEFSSPIWLPLACITLYWLAVFPFGFWLLNILEKPKQKKPKKNSFSGCNTNRKVYADQF